MRTQPSYRRGLVPRSQRGVSLMEVMVGAALGMICVIVIFQVVALWEGRTRTTSSGSDAQISGTLGSYGLERDLKLAGMGIGTAKSAIAGCTVNAYNEDRTPSKPFTFPLAPVSITVGADGAPDTIRVLYGNSQYFVADQVFDASTATSKTAHARSGLQLGDLVVVASETSTDCAMVEITSFAAADNKTVNHQVETYTDFYTAALKAARYNAPGGLPTTYSTGRLFDLGPAPTSNVWSINAANVLVRQNDLAQPGTPGAAVNEVSEGVVGLKAQYGVDGANGGTEDNSIAATEWTTTAPTDWSKLRAIRFAILARSQQFEAQLVTTADNYPRPSWVAAADTDTLGFAKNNPNGNADDWQHYRYRLYENIVPLRNIMWGNAP